MEIMGVQQPMLAVVAVVQVEQEVMHLLLTMEELAAQELVLIFLEVPKRMDLVEEEVLEMQVKLEELLEPMQVAAEVLVILVVMQLPIKVAAAAEVLIQIPLVEAAVQEL